MPQDETVMTADPSADKPLQAEISKLSPSRAFWYSFANLGYGMFFSFNNASLPLFLERYTKNAVILGLMGSTHSFEGAVIQPIVGRLSDRHRSRLGRRRPFILMFAPLSALFMALSPAAGSLPANVRLAALVACIFTFTVTFNIAFDPYQALMPDITPVHQRGRVMAFWTLLGVIGQASIVFIPIDISLKFYLVAGVMLITTLLACLFVTERPSIDLEEQAYHHHGARELISGIVTLKEAIKGLLVFGISGTGVGAVFPYLTLFVKKIAHTDDNKAQWAFLVLMVATLVTVMPCGWIADRIGAKKMLFAGLGLIAVASLCGLWVNSYLQIMIVLGIAGIGNAAQSAAAYPLMTQLVPEEEIGWYTGLQTFMLSFMQPLTIVVTGMMINSGNYRAIFVVCSFAMVVSLGFLAAVSQRKANQEIMARRIAMGWQVVEP